METEPDTDMLSSLPAEIWAIVAGHVNTSENPALPPVIWAALRLASHSLSHKATFQLLQLSIKRQQATLDRWRTDIAKMLGRGALTESSSVSKFEQTVTVEARVQLIIRALDRHVQREMLVASLPAALTWQERALLVNSGELTILLITALTIEKDTQALINPRQKKLTEPNFPFIDLTPPGAFPGAAPGVIYPPGFPDDFDRDLDPFPDPFAPHPMRGGRGGGRGGRGGGFGGSPFPGGPAFPRFI